MTNKSTLAQRLSHAWPWTKPIGSSPTTSRLLRYSLLCMLVLLCGGSAWTQDKITQYTFEKVTSNEGLVVGEKYIIVCESENVAMGAAISNNKSRDKVAISIKNSTIISESTDIAQFTLGGETNAYTLSDGAQSFLALTKASNEIHVATSATGNDAKWKIDVTKSTPIESLGQSGRYIKYNNNNSIFRCYESGQKDIVLYKLTKTEQVTPKKATTITLSEGYTTSGMEGTTIDLPTATVMAGETAVTGATVNWSSSDEEIATIGDGVINLLKPGKVTITASFEEDDNYLESENGFELTVTESPEIANPYTYTFEAKVFDAKDQTKKLSKVNWALKTDGNYFGYDGTNGQQFGSSKAPATELTLSTSDIPGTITSITIKTNGASNIAATIGVTVGETAFKVNEETTASLTSTATEYEFTGSASGDIVLTWAQTSSKAIYIKSIDIEYSEATTPVTPDPFYILGDMANWDRTNPTAMTWDSENEVYTYTFTSTADATYFCFADGTQTAEEAAADNEWTTFNSTYRWALGTGGNYTFDLDNLGTALELSQGDKTIVLPAGEWTISVTPDMKMTITGETTPVTPSTLYILGSMNGWERTAATEMTWDAENEVYTYDYSPTEDAYFVITDKKMTAEEAAADNEWTTFNSTYRWALGEGDTEVGQESLNTPLQLQKTSGAIKLPAGTWTISINPSNMTMTITDKAAEEPVAGDVTALWDFRSNANPRAVGLFQGQNAQGKLDSNVQGIQLDIDATTGKFDSQARTSDAQVNNGTVIKVPVRHAGDEVTVLGNYQVNYTIGANEESVTELSKTYTATEADAQLGNVVITSTGTTYFYYIQVVQKEYIAPVTGFDNVEGSIKWTIGNETSGTVSDDIKEAIGSTSLTVGGDLTQTTYSAYAANNGVEMVVFNPNTNKPGTVESAMVEYRVKVKAGLKFKPTSVSYDAIKEGTDDATYSWSYTIDGEESQKTVAAKDDILRNNNTTGSPALTHVHNLTVDETSEFTFRIYVSGFNSGKKLALSNIIINGTVNGTIEEIPSYTLTAVASPEEGGSVKITPAGGEYEEGSTIKVTATPNFGYHFVKWQDATETTVSEDATYSFGIQKNEELTAVFTAVETYALTVNVEGGNSYQVTASPEATDGKYEAGTEVTLTAVENPVVKFTNWSTSATEKEIKVTINEDTEITANFAATDEIVAAWDFYEALGNSGKQDRAAAFKGENNDGTILTLRNAEGTSVAWLDRNYTNPYNGAICAINWQKNAYGKYYWQTKVNASSYKTMKVYSEMYYNYRAYNKYDVQYSVDGTEWTTLGTFELSKDDWSKLTLDIPEAADNKEEVYVRWIKAEDAVLDETASDNNGNNNDGIGIANIFITGTKELVDDGTAPVLQSQVPAANSENASINGQVVLTFDEKIQLTGGTKATLGEEELEPIVAGKALMFKYQGLDYDTEYTFTLPANFVSDLMNNTLEEKISFTFKTMTRPTVTKAAYDFIVPDDGTFAEAVAAANSRSDKTKRYFIFVKKGKYQLMGTGETENAEDDNHNPYTYTNRITDITASNISIIGEDRDATILYNSPDHEGIGVTATLRITKDVENTYIEDITIKNAWEYTGTTGRAVTIQDKGTRTIAKNVKLLSYQDTYYSNNQSGEFFFEDGEIHGTVDFVCGTGDVIYKDVTLYLEKRTGNVISAPNQPKEFGYVFLDCTIDGDAANEGTYYLGRPWGTGVKAQFVNTQMKVTPAAAGWTEMGAGRYPAVFAEFNSYKEDMSPIDLSGRKTSFGASDTSTAVESSGAELTTEQVASLTVQNIFGDWLPTQYTIQEEAPSNVKIDQNGKLTWDADDYALCYVVCADGDAIAVTTENSFDTATAVAPALRRSGDTVTYTVRAANAMGGLGEESAAASPATGINATLNDSTKDSVIYDLNGRRVMTPTKGVYIINGKKVVIK